MGSKRFNTRSQKDSPGSGFGEGIGKEATEMCKPESKKECEHPEKLKGKPEECSPEQIKECHGEVVEHPCVKQE